MKYIYHIIGGLLLCVHTMCAQVTPVKTKTEIVMTVEELNLLLEQIGKAELTSLRDKQLDSILSAVSHKTTDILPTSVVINEYRLLKTDTASPTMAMGTKSSTTIARTASSTTAVGITSMAAAQRPTQPAAVAQTQNTTAIAQQLAQLSGAVEQLRKQQQLLLAALAVNTGVVAAKSTANQAIPATTTETQAPLPATTATATVITAVNTPIVTQSVTPTANPIHISAERRSELELLLAAYGHKKVLVYFANNKTIPLPYDPAAIDEMVTMLKAHPELSVLLEGYASAVGSVTYNNVLSMERAVAVSKILTDKGIAAERILTAFKGIDLNTTPAQARRVELRVIIRSY